ncbi:hypothetical protein ACWOC1_13240 [Enterococcus quebecensis]|uniref:4-oxalocrotonate tautomerase n=1 Tax=Enterococcus quebecensis TaxID=903983 RepID=A0A1E5GTF0_9ENTE|nr:hypothetical protein [Enterococcus quebecensis]OEG15957.1 hypothetical protein BCR23_07355 [Enterococcus quebecensis]OJG74929.1 hypothetical protein RV12_GL001974 [Enterococcus quebecensis]
MPFFTLKTSMLLSDGEKADIISNLTRLTTKLFDTVAPDKIQVTIQNLDRANFGRAGSSLVNQNFSYSSRFKNANYDESYFNKENGLEDLITIELDIWEGFSIIQKNLLGEEINNYLVSAFNITGDNCLILIRDMIPANWIQNGIAGNNPSFLDKSRTI